MSCNYLRNENAITGKVVPVPCFSNSSHHVVKAYGGNGGIAALIL
jgi:hypothetical protein